MQTQITLQSYLIMNHYQALGVARTADAAEIKKAYKRKTFDLHPDRNKSPDAKDRFQRVREAYECLSVPAKRAMYDQSLDRPTTPFDDLETFFYRTKQEEERKRARAFAARITLEEACQGCKRYIPGYGKYVNIPAGVIDGSRLKAGDISIIVNVEKHSKFQLRKHDLYATIYIDAIQAMVGIDLVVNHPSGEKLKTKIPAGTQEGQKLCLKGKGVSNQREQGDLIIFCHIVIPQLTDNDKDSIMYLLNSSSAEI